MAARVEEAVLGLDVPVDDAVVVGALQRQRELRDVERDGLGAQDPLRAQVVK